MLIPTLKALVKLVDDIDNFVVGPNAELTADDRAFLKVSHVLRLVRRIEGSQRQYAVRLKG